ncbi:SLC19A2_3 [Mytilus coruscus]|uniref:SLC19A2_3 n=1 Tax=Mytilus coruscus TaxID=42192 RepID=A0A6J8C3X0_MYTCO|nr:SLC19A2_3 [Mytilus coruscus]
MKYILYAYLLWLIPVFLLTDYFLYQPMLVLEGATYIATWCILLWAQGVLAFKFTEVCYGLVTATEIAYCSYLFTMVSNEHYKIITSLTRAAILIGRFAAYLTGQLLVSFNLMDYKQLKIISMVSVSLAFVLTVTLRRPSHSDIFHSQKLDENKDVTSKVLDNKIGFSAIQENQNVQKPTFKRGILFSWKELKTAYSDKSVITWSFLVGICIMWTFASPELYSEPLGKIGHPVSRNYFISKLKTILMALGYSEKDYSGHSFRSGVATSASSKGIEDSMIQSLGRWKSDCFKRYSRKFKSDIESTIGYNFVTCPTS